MELKEHLRSKTKQSEKDESNIRLELIDALSKKRPDNKQCKELELALSMITGEKNAYYSILNKIYE